MKRSAAAYVPSSIGRYLFGDDIFISYSHHDGHAYALSLSESLPGMRCYSTQFGAPASEHVSAVVRRRLMRSTVLVLIGTDKAVHSEPVRQEIEQFLQTGRPIVPISFSRAIEKSPLDQLLKGLPITSVDAQEKGFPSPAVVSRVVGSVTYTRYDVRRKRLVMGAIAAISILALSSTYLFGLNHRAKQNEACDRAYTEWDAHRKDQESMDRSFEDWEQVLIEFEAAKDRACGDSRK